VTTFEPASRYSHAELTQIFNAGYEGYFAPVVLDETAFRYTSRIWDDDLDESRVALVDGEPVGICKLAVRGERGWIGGIGVAAAQRGKGVGEALLRQVLDAARRRGLREIWLEVLIQNEPAIRLYEKLGFRHVRVLEVWTLEPLVLQQHKVPAVPAEQAQALVARRRRDREPWQRSDETVANLENVEGLEGERGALLFRLTDGRVSLLQAVADDEAAAQDLLRSLPAGATALQWLNGPGGDPFNAAIASLGGTQVWRQHEMVLDLDS
jgi:ribosomal protein S18 acetylase RimI-like enzyme